MVNGTNVLNPFQCLNLSSDRCFSLRKNIPFIRVAFSSVECVRLTVPYYLDLSKASLSQPIREFKHILGNKNTRNSVRLSEHKLGIYLGS